MAWCRPHPARCITGPAAWESHKALSTLAPNTWLHFSSVMPSSGRSAFSPPSPWQVTQRFTISVFTFTDLSSDLNSCVNGLPWSEGGSGNLSMS